MPRLPDSQLIRKNQKVTEVTFYKWLVIGSPCWGEFIFDFQFVMEFLQYHLITPNSRVK
jgi:hypothetical protein